MRLHLRLSLACTFGMLVVFLASPNSMADFFEGIEITTNSGITQELSEVRLSYSDEHKNTIDGYFRIYPDDRPYTCLWVNLSKVKVATFEKRASEQTFVCKMTLDSGEELAGRFHDPGLKISGDNELGEVEFDLLSIQAMKFTRFGTLEDGKWQIVDRHRYVQEEAKTEDKDTTTWSVVTNGETKDISGRLYLWDSYNTDFEGWGQYIGWQRLDGGLLRWGTLQESFSVDFEGMQTTVAFSDIDGFERSPKPVHNEPEVIIRKAGQAHTVRVLVRTVRLRKMESDTYGPFESDDYLVWDTPFGYEGLALAPARDIRVTRRNAPSGQEVEQAGSAVIDNVGVETTYVRQPSAGTEFTAVPPEVLEALGSPDPNTRIDALRRIGQMGSAGRTAIPALQRLYCDSSTGMADGLVTTVQKEVLQAVANIGAVDALIEALNHEDVLVRAYAASFLGDMGPHAASAISGIAKLLDSDSPEFRWSGGPPIKEGMHSLQTSERELAADALRKIGPAALPVLLDALPDSKGAIYVAEALGRLGQKDAVPKLILTLESDNDRLREEAAQALGNLGDRAAVEPLIRLLNDQSFWGDSVRSAAIKSLARLQAREAVPRLTLMLRDPVPMVRAETAKALGQLNGSEAIGALKEALEDESALVRECAAVALVKLGYGKGDPQIIDSLVEGLKSDFFDELEEYADALCAVGDGRSVSLLVECLERIQTLRSERLGNVRLLQGSMPLELVSEHEADLERDVMLAKEAVTRALSAITGKNLGPDPVEWKELLRNQTSR